MVLAQSKCSKPALYQPDKSQLEFLCLCPVWVWGSVAWGALGWRLFGFKGSKPLLLAYSSCCLAREGLCLWRPSPPSLLHSSKGAKPRQENSRRLQTPPNHWLWKQWLGSKPKFHSCCLGNPWVDYDLLLENPCHGHV